jgi:MFS transporter, DHA1 family, tetracycline resistance protein
MSSARSPHGLLFISLFNSILGFSILFPILAPLGRQLHLTEVEVGWLSTAYSMMQFVASPLWGRKSERVGRKPVLLTGILGYGIGFGGFGIIAQIGQSGELRGPMLFTALLATRVIGGALSAATMPTAQAYIADTTQRSERASGMALIGAAFGMGVVFGPGIGAGLAHWGLLLPVYVSAAVAFINALFVWWFLPEPPKHIHLTEFAPSAAVLARVWPILGVGLTITLAAVSMEQTVAFLFQDVLHLSAEHAARRVGVALVCYGVIAVLAQGVFVRRSRWSPLRLVLVGVPIAALGFAGLAVARDFLALTIALALQGFGQGIAMPGISAALSLSVADSEQGEVAGLNSASQALGRTIGPVLGTMLYRFQPRSPYQMSVFLQVLVLLAVVLSPWLRRRVSSGAAG